MRIVFMGTPDFAVPSLQTLLDRGHEVVGVFTQPDKPQGRKQILTPPPVKELALRYGIPVYQPVKMRDGTVAALLRELSPQLVVVVAYGRLLPKEVLEIPSMGCVNLHGSLLPKYRGAGPIQWAVINDEAVTGVTTMYMGEELDAGDMLLKEETPIGENETAGELFDRLSGIGARLLAETIEELEKGTVVPKPQDPSQVSYAPMLDKKMAWVDFTQPARKVHKLICGLSPWPSALCGLDGKTLKLHRSVCVEGYRGEPGTILDDQRMIVACGQGAIELLEVQLEGAKRMSAAEFMRGRRITVGKKLTGIS